MKTTLDLSGGLSYAIDIRMPCYSCREIKGNALGDFREESPHERAQAITKPETCGRLMDIYFPNLVSFV